MRYAVCTRKKGEEYFYISRLVILEEPTVSILDLITGKCVLQIDSDGIIVSPCEAYTIGVKNFNVTTYNFLKDVVAEHFVDLL